jgi:hypothetical protein
MDAAEITPIRRRLKRVTQLGEEQGNVERELEIQIRITEFRAY